VIDKNDVKSSYVPNFLFTVPAHFLSFHRSLPRECAHRAVGDEKDLFPQSPARSPILLPPFFLASATFPSTTTDVQPALSTGFGRVQGGEGLGVRGMYPDHVVKVSFLGSKLRKGGREEGRKGGRGKREDEAL